MKPSSPWLTAWFVVTISCLAWIGGITFVLVHFLDLPQMTGWIIAGSLGFSTILALTFVLYELRNAMELPDDMDPSQFDMFPVPPHAKRPASESHAAASLRIKRQFN